MQNSNFPTEAVDHGREYTINQMIATLDDIREGLQNGQHRCSLECDSIRLGSLILKMKSMGLLSPRPSPPFRGLTFEKLRNEILAFKSPNWHDYSDSYYINSTACQISVPVKPIIESLEDHMGGLDIASFGSSG
jgi:hypothetical protein